jgi:hypothetical protein
MKVKANPMYQERLVGRVKTMALILLVTVP